jgi:murein DD-endopeptidase MepM/ murein hydrolase activator NlpD
VAALLLLLVAAATACAPFRSFRDDILRTPPYERYVASLRDAGIHRTTMGAGWIDAGERALTTPSAIEIPDRRAAHFQSDSPSAIAYRVELRRGQIYHLALEPEGSAFPNVFVDLFHVDSGVPPQRVAAIGPPSRQLAFEPSEDDAFIVRIQPELLAAGRLEIAHRRRAALLFPVPGAGPRNVQSLFGAARGRREHQGIDIFAARGTPVVAAADGWISSISPNQLGGNVVWLWDPARAHTLYYAHLDRHAVSAGQRVRKGDVVGFVGNTGNARTTAPHLHFGIYRRGQGAIDPLYYVVDPPP